MSHSMYHIIYITEFVEGIKVQNIKWLREKNTYIFISLGKMKK